MRKFELWISLFIVVLFPALLFRMLWDKQPKRPRTNLDTTAVTYLESEASQSNLILVLHNDQVITMQLDEYLCGVVLGEMPASFDEEALKAQAVAARTYTLKKLGGSSKHLQADICTDFACCQAYVTPEENSSTHKVRSAVNATSGEVLLFEGDLIDATYFSCSGGRTEAAVAVWGTDIPYLQAIDSPWDEDAKYHRDTVVFKERELMEKLGISDDVETFTLSNISYTDGDGVENIEICGKVFTGLQLRSLLGLRSTAFTIENIGDDIFVTTKGYGHRVGMSQYGAEAMAQQGSQYNEILAFYYPHTQLEALDAMQMRRLFDKEGNL